MIIKIDKNNVSIIDMEQINSGEYNITECSFIFSQEYSGLSNVAVFTGEDGKSYKQIIVDNQCFIPSEILEKSQVVRVGVYGYEVEGETLILRYSPQPTKFFIAHGSYIKNAENTSILTPTEVEQLQAQITNKIGKNNLIAGSNISFERDGEDITINATGGAGGTSDHSELENLDYEHSGHIGFQKDLDLVLENGMLCQTFIEEGEFENE